MLHSWYWKRIFWLVLTIFFIYFFGDYCQWKLFFLLMETYFWTNPSFQLLKKDFFYSGNRLFYLRAFSSNGNCHWYEWKPVLKNRTNSCWWKLICWLAKTFFFFNVSDLFQRVIRVSGNAFFSPKENVVFFSELSCLLVETIN